jgi:hypothetical protein
MRKTVISLIIVGVILSISSFTFMQKKYRIFIAEYDCTITPKTGKCNDTIVEYIGHKERHIKIYLESCKGKMFLECYDSNNVKIEEGSYINSLDLLKKYTNAVSPRDMSYRIKVAEYYQPLRSGKWLFYDLSGKLTSTKTYNKGVVADSTILQ